MGFELRDREEQRAAAAHSSHLTSQIDWDRLRGVRCERPGAGRQQEGARVMWEGEQSEMNIESREGARGEEDATAVYDEWGGHTQYPRCNDEPCMTHFSLSQRYLACIEARGPGMAPGGLDYRSTNGVDMSSSKSVRKTCVRYHEVYGG